MKMISWNVNGLRACMNKGFKDFFEKMDADIFAIQETKMQEEQKSFAFAGYFEYWNSAIKKGYSGTLIYTKKEPLSVHYGLVDGKYNDEGRVITLEYPEFYFVTVYVPNSQRELTRLDYRMEFEEDFRAYLVDLDQLKPVVLCGDLNVAHQPIDLKNPVSNQMNAGYTIEERTKFGMLLDAGFVDSFRWMNPEKVQYSWWSYMMQARERNIGWRIDYFVISERLKKVVDEVKIYDEVLGSDHCPVGLKLNL